MARAAPAAGQLRGVAACGAARILEFLRSREGAAQLFVVHSADHAGTLIANIRCMPDQSTSEKLEASEPQPTTTTTPARPRESRQLHDESLGALDPDDPQICRGID